MKTLTQLQEEAVRRLDVVRSSELRYRHLQHSVYKWYMAQLKQHCGIADVYPKSDATESWGDVLGMVTLRKWARAVNCD